VDGELLGPLRAKRFSFGDIDGVGIPLTPNAPPEQGVRISNALEDNNALFDTRTFENDAIPGWDVELYRNGALLAFQEIGQDGRYRFEDIALFKGDNDFRFIFYGPQGEVREEREFIKVDGRNKNDNTILYDVAFSRKNTTTYNISEDSTGQGSPHLAARFDYFLGNIQASSGARMRDQGGQNKTYLSQSLSQELGGVLYNLDGAYELDGETGLSLTARRNFGRHNARAKVSANTDGFSTGDNDSAVILDNEILDANVAVSGPLTNTFLGLKRLQYSTDFNYSETANGVSVFDGTFGVNSQIINRLQFNAGVNYQNTTEMTGEVKEDAQLDLNLSGRYGTTRWRAGAGYGIMPEASLENVSLKLNKPYNSDLELEGEIDHKIEAKITEASLAVNWNTPHAIYSPRLTYDSDGAIFAGLNTRFGLGYEPRAGHYKMYGQNLSGGGAVSARVYLDKDGSVSFTEGDEPLENVDVKSLQSRRIEASDKDGIAYLRALNEGRKTDITIDEGTLEDPYYISLFEGLAVRPRAGVVTEIDFPVAVAGTVDGTLSLKTKGGRVTAARQYKVHLMNLDGTIVASTTTGLDGYYVFERIRPGLYYVSLDNEQIRKSADGVQMPEPLLVSFAPMGTDLFGKNLSLQEGRGFFYSFSSDFSAAENKTAPILAKESDIQNTTYQIIIGDYKSKLALGLTWVTLQKDRALADALASFNLQQSYKDVSADKNYRYSLIYDVPAGKSLAEAQNACQLLAERGQYCRINIHHRLKSADEIKTAAL
jgi:hypothetical protein